MHGFSNSNPTRAAALPVSSGDLIADRRYAIAKDLEARGDLAAAADLLTQALERAPGFCVAWFAFAEVRERLVAEPSARALDHEQPRVIAPRRRALRDEGGRQLVVDVFELHGTVRP